MNLRQVKGNTWVLEGLEFIPLYRLDGGRCVLLDTGLAQEREELEQALLDHGLTPAGILCSHAHVDHGGNNRYFQEKYHIPVALTSREAGMCASLLSLKCYFLLLSPDMVEQDAAGLVHTPDVLIPDGDGPFSFAGAEFQILQTPGHSVGHISTLTPDRVCYVGDALLSREQLDAKLPYCLSHRMGMESREKLRGLDCDLVVMAHRGDRPAGGAGRAYRRQPGPGPAAGRGDPGPDRPAHGRQRHRPPGLPVLQAALRKAPPRSAVRAEHPLFHRVPGGPGGPGHGDPGRRHGLPSRPLKRWKRGRGAFFDKLRRAAPRGEPLCISVWEELALGYIRIRRSTGVRDRSQAASRESSRVAGS